MFEKEAEEYTKKNFCGCCPLTWKNQCKDFVNCGYHDSWKNGAEFGYNKSKAETALLSQHILDLQKDKGNLTDRVRELEQQIEKLIDFVLSKIECCDVCLLTDTCINSEGTCPYAGILAKGEEEVTREWLMQFISKEIKEK